MKAAEFKEAMEIARGPMDLADIDDSPLAGLALPDFQAPVTVSLLVAAKFLRWHTVCLDGSEDTAAVNEMAKLMRRRVIVC